MPSPRKACRCDLVRSRATSSAAVRARWTMTAVSHRVYPVAAALAVVATMAWKHSPRMLAYIPHCQHRARPLSVRMARELTLGMQNAVSCRVCRAQRCVSVPHYAVPCGVSAIAPSMSGLLLHARLQQSSTAMPMAPLAVLQSWRAAYVRETRLIAEGV